MSTLAFTLGSGCIGSSDADREPGEDEADDADGDSLRKPGNMDLPAYEVPEHRTPMLPPASELDIVEVGARGRVGCVKTKGNHSFCWGRYHGGPHQVPAEDAADVFAIVDPLRPDCERTDHGGVSCRGLHDETPVAIDVGSKRGAAVAELALGYEHICVRLESGTVQCTSQAVPPTPKNARRSRPDPLEAKIVDVPGLREVVSIAAEGETSAALTRDGSIYRWRGDATRRNPPEFLGRVEGAESIALGATTKTLPDGTRHGESFVCTLAKGRVHCAGDNGDGQLGLGDQEPRPEITTIPWPPEPTGIAGTIPGQKGVCFLWSPGGGRARVCTPTDTDGNFAFPLGPGLYEVCTQPHSGAADCPLCFFPVTGGTTTRVDASDLRAPTTDQGIFGLSVGIYPEGERVPHPLKVCVGGPKTEVGAPVAELNCTQSNACGGYALDLPTGDYRLHFAGLDDERSQSRQWCRFAIAHRTKFEVERREWRGDPTEPSCPKGATPDPLSLAEVRFTIREVYEQEDPEPSEVARYDELLDYGKRSLLAGDSIEDLAKSLELDAMLVRRTLLHGDKELETLVQER